MSEERKSLTKPLLVVFFVLLALVCYLLPQDVMLRERFTHIFDRHAEPLQAREIRFDEEKDPDLQSVLPNNETTKRIRKETPNRKGTLLVCVGDCAGCLNMDIAKWHRESKARGLSLVFFSWGNDSDITEFTRTLQKAALTIPIYQDKDREIAHALNAYYAGRAYLFDRQ